MERIMKFFKIYLVKKILKSFFGEYIGNCLRIFKKKSSIIASNSTLLRDSNEGPYRFCTMIGQKYLLKGLSLYASIKKNMPDFKLWICCLDEYTYTKLSGMSLSNVSLIHAKDIEDEELIEAKKSMDTCIYYWILKIPLIKYILVNNKIDYLLYCDPDTFLFSEAKPIFDELKEYSVVLCKQRCDNIKVTNGCYHTGFVGCRMDEKLCQCLNWWRKKCLDLCYKNMDTLNIIFEFKSLINIFPIFFPTVKILNDDYVEPSVLDIVSNNLTVTSQESDLYIRNDKLIAYSFESFDMFSESDYDLCNHYKIDIEDSLIKNIYRPYIETLRQAIANVGIEGGSSSELFLGNEGLSQAKNYFNMNDLTTPKEIKHTKSSIQYYCTLFNRDYLQDGLGLYYSLKKNAEEFHLWIYCLDNYSYEYLSNLNLEDTTLIQSQELEYEGISKVKNKRSVLEFCWTVKAPLIQYVFKKYNIESLVYCDADMYFFSSPQAIYDEWKGHSILLCRRRDNYEIQKVFGLYQTSLIGFRNDKIGLECIDWWGKRTLEWCYNSPQPDKDRWGDSKYLDRIPYIFSCIKILENSGVNPMARHPESNLIQTLNFRKDEVYFNGVRLIACHFGDIEKEDVNLDITKLDLATGDEIYEKIQKYYIDRIKNQKARTQ